MKTYIILEKHIERQELGEEDRVYYEIIDEIMANDNLEANDMFKENVDSYTTKHGSYSGDSYFLLEKVSEIYIVD
jgi:hypothetical protein